MTKLAGFVSVALVRSWLHSPFVLSVVLPLGCSLASMDPASAAHAAFQSGPPVAPAAHLAEPAPGLADDSSDPSTDSEPQVPEPDPSQLPASFQPQASDPQVSPSVTPRIDKIPIPFDKPVLVAYGPVSDPRFVVYLHGKCGDIEAFRSWVKPAVRVATLVAMAGDEMCKGGWRSTWSHDIVGLDRRIRVALETVAKVAGRPPPRDPKIIVVGYSLGSTRAESLMKKFPTRYSTGILIAGPTEPETASFLQSKAVVVMAGARDRRSHLQKAADNLAASGLDVTFRILPDAKHGEYGPYAEKVMDEALTWLIGRE